MEIAIFRAKYERKALTDYMNLDGYRSFNLNVGYLNPNFSKPYQRMQGFFEIQSKYTNILQEMYSLIYD